MEITSAAPPQKPAGQRVNNSTVNYCRREIDEKKFCMKQIATKNVLDWCEDCRKALPFWPTK